MELIEEYYSTGFLRCRGHVTFDDPEKPWLQTPTGLWVFELSYFYLNEMLSRLKYVASPTEYKEGIVVVYYLDNQ